MWPGIYLPSSLFDRGRLGALLALRFYLPVTEGEDDLISPPFSPSPPDPVRSTQLCPVTLRPTSMNAIIQFYWNHTLIFCETCSCHRQERSTLIMASPPPDIAKKSGYPPYILLRNVPPFYYPKRCFTLMLRPKFNPRTGQRPYVWTVSSVTCRRSVVSSGYSGFLHQKLISSSSFHRLDMTLDVAEALNPNHPNPLMTLIPPPTKINHPLKPPGRPTYGIEGLTEVTMELLYKATIVL